MMRAHHHGDLADARIDTSQLAQELNDTPRIEVAVVRGAHAISAAFMNAEREPAVSIGANANRQKTNSRRRPHTAP